jgi:addiction module HigA family antidote
MNSATEFLLPDRVDLDSAVDSDDLLPSVHPGEVLEEEFLKPLGITPYRLAKSIDVSQTHVGEILKGVRSVTSLTALKLSAYFGTSAEFWINLQSFYDLEQERRRPGSPYRSITRYEETVRVMPLGVTRDQYLR